MDAILVVEDSHSFASLLQSRIRSSLALDVVRTGTLSETRACLQGGSQRFFLAVLDLNLPDAPNGEVVDLVLAQKVPAIVLTGTFKKEFQDRIREKGVLDYFVKDNIGVIDAVIHAVDRIRKNKHINILVVDDSRSVRRAISGLLTRFGFHPLEAEDGQMALAVLESNPVHLVVTDYQMPQMDGIQLIKKLRTRHSRDEVAVIGLSSFGDRDLAVQFIKAGANDFLLKPFQPEELLCRVYQNIDTIERRHELESLLERHRSVLTHALDAIITIDAQGVVLDYNPAAENLFGYERDKILRKNIGDCIIPKASLELYRAGLSRWSAPGSDPSALRRRFEVQGHRADGEIIDLQVALTGGLHNGQPRFTGFLQDITDRKQLLKSLEETLAVAETANQSKSKFIANMSHEFRTPMNAVLGFTDLALKADLSPKVRGYLEKIENASRSLMGVINDILDFSKIDAGRMELDPVPFDLNQLLDRLADLFSKQVSDKGIELVFLAPLTFDQVLLGDVTRLEQILINLIRNAVKFTEQGSITVHVQLTPLPKKQYRLDFAVRDTGIGIETEVIPRLFAPFVQADGSTTRKYGGTGLGLSICNRLVNLMEGQINVESHFGKGSVFSFHVQVGHFAENRRELPVLPDELLGKKALLLDDNPVFCDHFSALLEVVGLVPVVVHTAGEAWTTLATGARNGGPFDFLFVDWHMPDQDGLAIIAEIQARLAADAAFDTHPKIILLTPFGQDAIRNQGETVGVDGFLDKPVTRTPLLRVILADQPARVDGIDRRLKYNLSAEKATAAKVGGSRILLVEESDLNQQVVREHLERVGLVVERALGGPEAIALVEQYDFDALLMEVRLPGMDGFAVTRHIRAMDRYKDLPIIAMATHALPEEVEKSKAAGMNGLLEKPIRPERLYGMLSKWIVAEKDDAVAGDFAVESPVLPHIAGLDSRLGLKRIAGNHALYRRLLQRFVRTYDTVGEELSQAFADGEIKSAVRGRLHALQGLAKNIGAVPLYRVALELETGLTDGRRSNDAALQATLATFHNRLHALVSGIKEKILQSSQRVSSCSMAGIPNVVVDKARAVPLVIALASHLSSHSVQVDGLLTELGELWSGTPAILAFQELQKQVQSYNFKEALEGLQRMATSAGIDLSGECPPLPTSERNRILIVDDLRSNVDILKEILGDFDCFVALDGEQALRVARNLPAPDIVLLDIMMPDMNGYEVCQHLKSNPDTSGIPVIFVTARREVSDQAEGFRLGGVDYITKPFNAQIVRHRVLNHLELKRHRDQLEQQVRERTRELHAAQLEAERRKEAAEAGNQAKSRFLATMSHEIRTPMNAILGMAEALQETLLTPEQKQYVAVFRRSGHGLMRLINDVLDLSKVEAGRLDLAHEPFDLLEALDALHKMIEPRAQAKGIAFLREIDPALPRWVVGDAHRFHQVVLNLLDNAVKFTHDGSVALRVTPDPHRVQGVQVVVIDTGVGIPVDKQEEVFRGFSQADTSITRRFGGSGLGLAICKQLVSLMGGSIAVESVANRGSTFHFTLPMPSADHAGAERAEQPVAEEGSATVPVKAAILLAEDAEDNQLLVEIFLRNSPYRLTIVENGKRALELCQKKDFDLVLMDVQMPVMDGYTATRHIRQFEQETNKPPLPIVALTAHAFADETTRATEAGCTGFLTKPVSKKRLLDAIATALQERQAGETVSLRQAGETVSSGGHS
ncbi:MAG: response regulator [Magnetococcales bacterium]|nr:response regulator [Magnetococcales bacterium]